MGASPEEWLQCIGKNIRKRRTERGLTQEKLSESLHTEPRTIRRHEKGQGLSFDWLPAYADVLKCSTAELMFENTEIKDPVLRAFLKIKGCPQEVQVRIMDVIDNCFALMKVNK